MPPLRNSSKRTLEEIVNHEDSDDEDYDDKAPGPSSKSKPSRNRQNQRATKRQRRTARDYGGSDVDSDSQDILEDDSASFGDESEEEIETNDKTGRPIRRATKKEVKYEESDPDDEDDRSAITSSEDELQPTPKRNRLIVKLKASTPAAMARALRPRSTSHGNKPPQSSAPSGARRSSRLSHDQEDLLALTTSGHHIEVTRTGSREPDIRPTRGGKGMKHPSKSTIDEEAEEYLYKQDDDDQMEIAHSQQEILDSVPPSQAEHEEIPHLESDLPLVLREEVIDDGDETADPLQEDAPEADPPRDDDEEDEGPINRGRLTRGSNKRKAESPPIGEGTGAIRKRLRTRAVSKRANKRQSQGESSDFEPEAEGVNDEQLSSSEGSEASPRKSHRDDYDSSNNGRRSTRSKRKATSAPRSAISDEEDEIAAELEDLKKDTKKKRPANAEILFEPRGTRRGGKKPNYNLLRSLAPIEDDEEVAAAPSPSARARKAGAGSWQRSFFNVYGPFGGGGGTAPVLGGPGGPRAQGDVDSDSSDDEVMKQPRPLGGTVGMTPTQPSAGGFNPFAVQPLNTDPLQGGAGTPANLGKVKDKQALADADPLGVDQNVNFDKVGGLRGHIDQLKEMVYLPLLYPEIFMRFKITPPRGVLFHGPPGTGKTLLARALASSASSQGRKVTFYMRKGADALSKWVGEAERQLRLLFEEARKNQPSIIFFDEIDGLAPVRSSKQEQIHASIVSTLLALMDGMDGRGQVIVIGATNRPDSIDPALRRPGRFDREFYFPLPNTEARREILGIHTQGWNPPLDTNIKDELAEMTKGYGGADLRALCTEAALNAVQRRYPQIYKAKEKLLIDPKTIEVTPKDFMISIKKMTPSSERSTSSGAAPLPPGIAPLLKRQVFDIEKLLAEVLPQKKKLTALQEAEFEDVADGLGFGRERMQQAFENARVFRPRLLIHGRMGMGQQYVASALLNHFEGLHVQNFDLQTLLSDSTTSAESTVIRLFSEVKMHKPSVIYISNVLEWYRTVGTSVVSTFFALLRSIKPTDPILVLGLLEEDTDQELDDGFRRELFGYSKRNMFKLEAPTGDERREFFEPLKDYVRTSPSDFPDPTHRKKRHLEILRIAPPEPVKPPPPPTKEEVKAQKKRDRQTLNLLKIRLQPIMDQIRTRHKKFRNGVIEESHIRYLLEEADPGTVTSDLHTEMLATASFRPFEIGRDQHGVTGFVDQANGKFYYNLDSVIIEKRLSNGYYKRPKDFLADIKRLAKDAKTAGDEDRLLKANELLANVEVDIGGLELGDPVLTAECEKVYQRELAREKELLEKQKAVNDSQDMPPPQAITNVPHNHFSGPSGTTASDGPIVLGEPMLMAKDMISRLAPVTPSRPPTSSSGMTNGIRAIEAPNTNGSNAYNSTDSGNQADAEVESHMEGQDSHPSSNQRSNETQKTQTTSSFGNRESAQPRPYTSYTAPSQQLRKETGMSEPLSQTDFMTPMQPGSTAADYANEASTTQTTSGKKNSSGERDQHNTQESGPNLFLLGERRSADGSEIPDTQSDQNSNAPGYSQASNPNPNSQALVHAPSYHGTDRNHSHARGATFDANSPPQPRTNGHLVDLLNPEPQSNLIQADEGSLDRAIGEIADRTSGMSVEQLEQVNSVLMDTLWKTRGEWNRRRVLDNLIDAFNCVTEDMADSGQGFGASSWGRLVQD